MAIDMATPDPRDLAIPCLPLLNPLRYLLRYRRRDRESERVRGSLIDYQVEFARFKDGEVSRSGAFNDFVYILGS
jgi:hypothetical protein